MDVKADELQFARGPVVHALPGNIYHVLLDLELFLCHVVSRVVIPKGFP